MVTTSNLKSGEENKLLAVRSYFATIGLELTKDMILKVRYLRARVFSNLLMSYYLDKLFLKNMF